MKEIHTNQAVFLRLSIRQFAAGRRLPAAAGRPAARRLGPYGPHGPHEGLWFCIYIYICMGVSRLFPYPNTVT